MSLAAYGCKAGGNPQPLIKTRIKLTNSGDILISGFDKYGFTKELLNPYCFKFDTQYIHIRDEPKYNYICYFSQFDFERPWVPSKMVPKVTPKDKSWCAIYDLLAESSLYAFGLSGAVPYDELVSKYGDDNYEAISMRGITDIVVRAIRKD